MNAEESPHVVSPETGRLDESQKGGDSHPPLQTRRSPNGIAIFALLLAAVIGNTIGMLVFLNSNSFSIGTELALVFCLGMLVAQPTLLSVWCALGNQKLVSRLGCSMGSLLALLFAFIIAFRSHESLPLELVLVFIGIGLAVTIFVQVPLWGFRWTTSLSITSHRDEPSAISNQFGIKHLLIATTIAALLILITEVAFKGLGREDVRPGEWVEITLFSINFIVLATMAIFLSVPLVLIESKNWAVRSLLILAMVSIPVLATIVFKLLSCPGPWGNPSVPIVIRAISMFTLGLYSVQLGVLLIFRKLGYRLT